jgi:hypothetical protein
VADALLAAVSEVKLLNPDGSPERKSARLDSLVKIGLNRKQLADWLRLLGSVAATSPAGAWYQKVSYMRSKAVMFQVVELVKKLDGLSFDLKVVAAETNDLDGDPG